MDNTTRKFYSRYSERNKTEHNRLAKPYIYFTKSGDGYSNVHLDLAVQDWNRDDYHNLSKWGSEYLLTLCKDNNFLRYDIGGCTSTIKHVPDEILESFAEHLYDVFEDFLSSYKPVNASSVGYDFTQWHGVFRQPV